MVLAALAACSPDGRSVVRAHRDEVPLRWHQRSITLYVYESPPGAGVSSSELTAAVTKAAAAWTNECAIDVVVRSTTAEPKSARNGVSSVIVRTRSWCPDGVSAKSECHDERLQALTRLYKSPPPVGSTEARIDEADIEINAVGNRWNIGADERHLGHKSLEASVLHEMGHLLGLDHPDETRAGWAGTVKHAMHPDPQAPGRELVFEPADVEIATLCAIYGERPSTLARTRYVLALACVASLGLVIVLIRRIGRPPSPRAEA